MQPFYLGRGDWAIIDQTVTKPAAIVVTGKTEKVSNTRSIPKHFWSGNSWVSSAGLAKRFKSEEDAARYAAANPHFAA